MSAEHLPGELLESPTPAAVADCLEKSQALWTSLGVQPRRPSVTFLASGAANAVYRFDVDGRDLVARVALAANTHVSLRAQAQREADILTFVGPDLTPALHHAVFDDSGPLGRPMLVMDFLPGRSLSYSADDLEAVAVLHAELHSTAGEPPASVERVADPVRKYFDEALHWFGQYLRSDRNHLSITHPFSGAFGRVKRSFGDFDNLRLVHADATYWNFRIGEDGARLFDWDWCRVTTPALDLAHFLSPVTTTRLKHRWLSREEEEFYIAAYLEKRSELDTSFEVEPFRDDLTRLRPAVVLHSAAWTAAWLTKARDASGDRRSDGDFDCLSDNHLAATLAPEFLRRLTEGGYW